MTILCQIILDPYDVRFIFDDMTEIYAEYTIRYYLNNFKKEFMLNFNNNNSYLMNTENLKFTQLIGKEISHKKEDGHQIFYKFTDGSWLSIIGFS